MVVHAADHSCRTLFQVALQLALWIDLPALLAAPLQPPSPGSRLQTTPVPSPSPPAGGCVVPNAERKRCGFLVSKAACEAKGCCYNADEPLSEHCYHPPAPRPITSPPSVGCYWYPRYANRKLSTIEAGTCTYLDIAGLCFFDVDAEGRLGWDTWDSSANMSCAAVFQATIADLKGAVEKVPSLQAKWVFSGATASALKGVFSNTTLSEQLVKDLANVSRTHGRHVVGGWAMDYEYHYASPAPAAVEGLTTFLRGLKASTGMGISWWSGFLYSFANVANISAIRPFVDVVEFGSYSGLQNLGAEMGF